MKYTILATRWWTPGDDCIGVVAIKTNEHDPGTAPIEWKAYIGLGQGFDQDSDALQIARHGSPLSAEEASGLFPHLPIAQYKTW